MPVGNYPRYQPSILPHWPFKNHTTDRPMELAPLNAGAERTPASQSSVPIPIESPIVRFLHCQSCLGHFNEAARSEEQRSTKTSPSTLDFCSCLQALLHTTRHSVSYNTHGQAIQSQQAPTPLAIIPTRNRHTHINSSLALHWYAPAGARVKQHPSSLQHDGGNHAPPCRSTRKYYRTAAHNPSQFPIETVRR